MRKEIVLETPQGLTLRPRVCRRWWERARGFMFRQELAPGEYLLFVNPQVGVISSLIHMRFVGLPLAVLWLDDGWRVVDRVLAHPWQVYAPSAPARYVLEGASELLDQIAVGERLMAVPEGAV